ncbi:MAG: ComEC/Rec2 family competence protein [Patescibacteria group bacterium]|jgi:competence protein ComEC
MKKKFKILIWFFSAVLSLSVIAWQASSDNDLKVYFFNIGQGDGILIRTPDRQNIVIDGGPDNSFITKLGATLPFYDRTIDLMILTHPHADHVTGLITVLERYQVKQVLSAGVIYQSAPYYGWLKLIQEKNIPIVFAQAGQEFIFGEVDLKVIYPWQNFANKEIVEKGDEAATSGSIDNLNNTSVVLKMVYRQNCVIFTGDLEIPGEELILKSKQNITADILKVGHHGSDTATSEKFLAQVNPKYAVIQVGQDNKFGLPDLRVIKRLAKKQIKIYRTDQNNDVLFRLTGQSITVDYPPPKP